MAELMKPVGKKNQASALVVITVVVVLAGMLTGWAVSGTSLGGAKVATNAQVEETTDPEGNKVIGIADNNEEFDAEGALVVGGIEGEGTHHLDRGAGPDKNVYLTSTVLDLGAYEGKKVQVWGETKGSQHAPWLLDVTRVKVVE